MQVNLLRSIRCIFSYTPQIIHTQITDTRQRHRPRQNQVFRVSPDGPARAFKRGWSAFTTMLMLGRKSASYCTQSAATAANCSQERQLHVSVDSHFILAIIKLGTSTFSIARHFFRPQRISCRSYCLILSNHRYRDSLFQKERVRSIKGAQITKL